jgi:3-hydroxyacyl-[acyl-carrier-protein] dehydratase
METVIRRAVAEAALAELELTAPGCGRQRFRLAPEFPGFSGHFPDNPVLPAMLQVLMGVMVCEKTVGCPLVLTRVERAKFVTQVQPAQEIAVACRLETANAEIRARVELEAEGRRAASMQLLLEPADNKTVSEQ